ncbi:MAG: hydrogenase iron-sulfur subunit, partial [Longimicrobiales bacterium]|nr:hydrogenase iron-sulfur subunit [Longimicrobiales bacterium]
MAFVLRAFQKGADEVIIEGCWLGECHHVTEWNYYALNMMHLAKKLLEHPGVDPERLRIDWISASEGVAPRVPPQTPSPFHAAPDISLPEELEDQIR